MKKLSIQEKAKAYDEAIKKVNDYYEGKTKLYSDIDKTLDYLFPELKESEDKRIIDKLIAMARCYTFEGEGERQRVISWLEKQGEHQKFRDFIQVGDKVTRNKDGILVNLSQLNRVAKKDNKQGEKGANGNEMEIPNSTWSKEDERLFQIVIDTLDRENHLGNISHTDLIACVRKLKSLKDRYAWKPSDLQMECLSDAIKHYNAQGYPAPILKELLDELRKLKG